MKKFRQPSLAFIIILFFLGTLASLPALWPTEYIRVIRVSDGDTIKLANGEKVRLTGIDTPESFASEKLNRDAQRSGQDKATIQKMGKIAAEFTRTLVLNKDVRLEYDVTLKDRYGRTLAYVFLKDGTFVNAEIIKQGFAVPLTIPPNVKYAEVFKRLYQESRAAHRGLWQEEKVLTTEDMSE